MAHSTNNLRFPAYGQANQPQIAAGRPSPHWAGSVEELRKGRLYLLAASDADRDLLAGLARRYYSSPRYDIVPALEAALVWYHAGEHGLLGRVLLAAVIHDLSLYVVSTSQAEAYLYRSGLVTPLLAAHSFRTAYRPSGDPADEVQEAGHAPDSAGATPESVGASLTSAGVLPQPDRASPESADVTPPAACEPDPERDGADAGHALVLYNTVSRLSFGDWVVLAPKGDAALMEAAVRSGARQGDLERAAAKVASRLKKRTRVVAPVGVIAMRGLSPVPGAGLAPRPQLPLQQPPKPAAMRPPREGRSPIWIALIIAAVAVAIALWISRPQIDISIDDLGGLLTRMLAPSPTVTMEPDAEGTVPPPEARAGAAPHTAKRMCTTSPSRTR